MKNRLFSIFAVIVFLYGSARALPNAPAWVLSIAPGTWQAISTNTLADVDPADDPSANPNYPNKAPWEGNNGQRCVIECWNGGAFASGFGTHGSLIVWGGGHSGYYGNEVYAFDMASRRWNRVTDPYPSPVFPVTSGIWPDGSPSCPHVYDQVEYHPGTNSFVTMRVMQDNSPVNVPLVAMFSFNSKTWRHSLKNTRSHHSSGGYSVYDPIRDVIWAEGGSGTDALTKFDPNANTGQIYGSFTNYSYKVNMTDAVAVYVPTHDLIAVTAFRSSSAVYGVDPAHAATQGFRSDPLHEGGTPPQKRSAHGWEWSDNRQSVIYWRSGTGVYEFKPPAGDWKTGTWTWGRLTAPSNGITPQDMERDNGVYSRFRIAQYADAEVAVVVNRIDGPVYAFRVPAGTTGAGRRDLMPSGGIGLGAGPNPFRDVVTIRVAGPARGEQDVSLCVFDTRGRRVADLTPAIKDRPVVRWNASRAPEGVYLVRLARGNTRIVKKVFRVK